LIEGNRAIEVHRIREPHRGIDRNVQLAAVDDSESFFFAIAWTSAEKHRHGFALLNRIRSFF